MKRNDEEFKAEIFRRFDDYKIKRKKRWMAAGGTALMLIFCVGILWMPVTSYLTPTFEETTARIGTTTTEKTTASTTPDDVSVPQNETNGQYDFEVDSETTVDGIVPPISMTVKCGWKTWKFDERADIDALYEYVFGDSSETEEVTVTTAESASLSEQKKYTVVIHFEEIDDEEIVIQEKKADFEAFLDELQKKE